ncbi:MAG: hypothetical protein ABEK59_02615 [Halobacteria archaeon]
MSYYKFTCDYGEEKECFARNLLGVEKEYKNEFGVNEGDVLFLHNTGGFMELIYGPFVAETYPRLDMVKGAFDGNMRWQVSFDWEDHVYSARVGDLYRHSRKPEFDLVNEPRRLEENEGEWLVETLEQGKKEITYVYGTN